MRGAATKYLGCEVVNPPIGETAAFHALQDIGGAIAVGFVLSRVAKIELGKVTVHVRGAHVVIGADNAALEDGKEILGGVAVNAARTRELADAVDGRSVLRELATDAVIEAGIIRHEVRRAMRIRDQRGANVRVVDMRNVKRTGATAALD